MARPVARVTGSLSPGPGVRRGTPRDIVERTAKVSRPDRILRFQTSERLLHWAIAIPFMVCFATAAILVVRYNPAPTRPYREVVSWVHRVSGVCLFALPTLVLLLNRRDYLVHLKNIREGWLWTLSDIKWLFMTGLAVVGRKVTLPEQGKFNAGEKLNFMMVMSTYPLFIVTGVLIWLPGVAFLAWTLHVGLAVAVLPLMLGHIFMATVNPGTRVGLSGMITGLVDRDWARHHYGRWFREEFERVRYARRGPPPAVEIPHGGVPVRCPSCRVDHAVPSWAGLVEIVLSAEPLACSHCGREIVSLEVNGPPHDLEWILQQFERVASGHPVDPGPRRLALPRYAARSIPSSPISS